MAVLAVRLALVLSSLALAAVALTQQVDIAHGDAQRGEVLYLGASSPYLSCFQCHQLPAVAPGMRGLSRRVAQERLTVAANADQTVEQYLAESIIDPQRYIVPPYSDVMPAFEVFGSERFHSMNVQDLRDLVAYLMTL